MKHLFYYMLCLPLLMFSVQLHAKKRRPIKAAAAPVVQTDWSNADSVKGFYHKLLLQGDSTTAYSVADSLILKHCANFDSAYFYLAPKTAWQVNHFQAAKAIKTLDDVVAKFQNNNNQTQVDLKLATLYASANVFDKAYQLQSSAATGLQAAEDELEKQNAKLADAENENKKHVKAIENAESNIKSIITIAAIVGALLLIVAIWAIAKLIRLSRHHKKQEEQIAHTQLQVEKASDEEEIMKREVKNLKEQLSRSTFENNQLKKNISESTKETLPLLRSQLESAVKESQNALPVEKYMQLQNTITRFNKQMREITGVE
jgi:HAMP domain-containing protein